jgi:hypothetical protein
MKKQLSPTDLFVGALVTLDGGMKCVQNIMHSGLTDWLVKFTSGEIAPVSEIGAIDLNDRWFMRLGFEKTKGDRRFTKRLIFSALTCPYDFEFYKVSHKITKSQEKARKLLFQHRPELKPVKAGDIIGYYAVGIGGVCDFRLDKFRELNYLHELQSFVKGVTGNDMLTFEQAKQAASYYKLYIIKT